jgi:hypothetical protein
MKPALVFAAIGETLTGVALLIVPAWIGRLLFGVELIDVAAIAARVAGIALIALGIACWRGMQLIGMLTYSAGVALFLAWVGLTGGSAGIILWPVVVLHVILTALLMRALSGDGDTKA